MTKMRRSFLGLALVIMCIGLLFPIWRIEIWAPQYPEGLMMQIAADRIVGNVDQINILNHYIGMKRIVPAEIPELVVIPWVLGIIISLGAMVILFNKIALAQAWFGLVGLLSVFGLLDFYRWGYDYGHNLNPDAPIRIPGLSYQPPLFGYKKILNIEAYSLPDLGGYLLALSLLVAFAAIFWEVLSQLKGRSGIFSLKNSQAAARKISPMIFIILLSGLISCTPKPQPLSVGGDFCEHCHMQISDARFGAEIITKKGRVYKFDSIRCAHDYLSRTPTSVETVLVADFFHPGTLIEAKAAQFLIASKITSPMGPGPLASADRPALQSLQKNTSGEFKTWEQISQSSF